MIRHLAIFAATALLSTASMAATIGAPAPAFSGVDAITGVTVNNNLLWGKIVVVEWNNFECPFVKKFYESGLIQKMQASAVKHDVVWLTINSSAPGKEGHLKSASRVNRMLSKYSGRQSHYLLDHDGSIGRAFGAKVTPHIFIIDKYGKLAYQGAIDDIPSANKEDATRANNYISLTLMALQSDKKVEPSSTKPYGCSVKY